MTESIQRKSSIHSMSPRRSLPPSPSWSQPSSLLICIQNQARGGPKGREKEGSFWGSRRCRRGAPGQGDGHTQACRGGGQREPQLVRWAGLALPRVSQHCPVTDPKASRRPRSIAKFAGFHFQLCAQNSLWILMFPED